MNIEENIANIQSLLLSKKPSHQTTNKKEISVRCPYCGDSKSNQSATHLYIEMRPPFRFHCFKCETSGVLNSETFRDLGIFTTDGAISVINANKIYKANNKIQKVSFKKQNLINDVYDTHTTINTTNYFNNRYGMNYESHYISNTFKAILDPIKFFERNNIYVQQGEYSFENSIGFISSDNSHIVFRDITNKQTKRYHNLNINRDSELSLSSKIYNISSNINIMAPEVRLVITEGIFDIIGVYNHFYAGNTEDTIFAAACGKAYNAVISKYLRMGFLNLNIEIYSDGDVDIRFYKNLKLNSPYLKNSNINVFYNDLYDPKTGFGKDYGVQRNQIKLKKIII